ncbi:MAG: N-formylglutamate amidohydrolase [Sandaracinus sp.]
MWLELARADPSSETAVIVEVPHAGREVPPDVRAQLLVGDGVILRDSDLHVDRLYAAAPTHGATLLTSRLSRYVVDLNRAPDDVDRQTVRDHPAPRPTQSRGVVWRTTTEGKPALREPITYAELERRLALYHAPYHAALEAEIARKKARFGRAIVVAGHSMPSTGKGGREKRADVVPGSRGRTSASARVIERVEQHFLAAGLTVKHDDPYRGGWSTQRYGHPSEGVHAIQIELSRALYADEATGAPIAEGVARVERVLGGLLDALGALEL